MMTMMTGTHLDPGHGAGGDHSEAVHEDGEQQEADLDTRISVNNEDQCYNEDQL